MTISDELTTLQNTKTAIKNAIVAKGVTVADTDTFASYADKIGTIEGSSTINNQDMTLTKNGTYTADDGYTGLGTVTVDVTGNSLYIDVPFTRPNLSTEGTLGGDSFAVSASHWDSAGAGGEIYKAVDGGSGTSWKCTIDDIWYKIYNPVPIKLTGVKFIWCWRNYSSNVEIFGSNDDNSYEKLNTISYQTDELVGTLIVSNVNYYKYYKMVFAKTTSQVEIYEINITAMQKTLINDGDTISLQDKTITANGSYTADEGNTALKNVIVNVPGIVPAGSKTVTNNGIIDVTNYAKVNVNVSSIDNTVLNSLIDGTATSLYNDEVTSIGSYAFYNHNKLTSVSFPNVTDVSSYAFQKCSNISSFELPKVAKIGAYAFSDCSKMTNFDLSNVTNILYYCAFSGCNGLTKVWLPSTITTIKAASSTASTSYNYSYSPFYNCSTSLVIYTDATNKLENWSNYCFHTSSTKEATVVYNATYENYLLDTKPTPSLTLTINVPDGCSITGKYSNETVTGNIIGVFPNTSITLQLVLDNYLPITKTYTIGTENITETVTIDEFTSIPTSFALSYPYTDQDSILSTLVDGTNFIINSDLSAITSGSSSYNVDSGTSYGHLVIQPTVETTLSVTGYVSSEGNFDFGAVYVGTQIYKPTQAQLKSKTTDSNGSYLFVQSGNSNSSTTYTTTLSANTLYYINFCYAKDSSSNSGSDRLIITDITTTAAK